MNRIFVGPAASRAARVAVAAAATLALCFVPASGPAAAAADPCPNSLARQQTGAAELSDCRAYELVTADTDGYDVSSDLVLGQTPLLSYPNAADRVIYAVHFGAIPGISGNPPNLGGEPYLATRGSNGWTTEYVGLSADGMAENGPYGSPLLAADDSLGVFAFGGADICDPCFADGSINVPLRDGDSLLKGMAGSLNPAADPAGEVRAPLSADGSHFVFGSEKRFEPAGNEGSVSIYNRDLEAGPTQVVSTLPGGGTMTGTVSELGISSNGDRVVIGKEISTDALGNHYVHPYMHLGTSASSVDLAPVTTSGVLFAGMTADGSRAFFTSRDKLLPADTDQSADLYMAEVDPAGALELSLLSTGASAPTGNSDSCDPVANGDGNNWNAVGAASVNDCGVVAIAGGGGIAVASGAAFFLSPETLDGAGTAGQPNLFAVLPGAAPTFVATLEPDNPLVRNAVADSEVHRYADFQVAASGLFAAFASKLSLTGFASAGHDEVYRYALLNGLACASCSPSSESPETDASLPALGLGLSESGDVFFDSTESLVPRDTNQNQDAYQWSNGEVNLVSPGLSSFDSGLLGISVSGGDAYFFTRDVLVPDDSNGASMKIYDARSQGGFFRVPGRQPCAASDECHGPATQPGAPPPVGTLAGTPSRFQAGTKRCRKGAVRRRGRCVARQRAHKKRQNRAHTKQGGRK